MSACSTSRRSICHHARAPWFVNAHCLFVRRTVWECSQSAVLGFLSSQAVRPFRDVPQETAFFFSWETLGAERQGLLLQKLPPGSVLLLQERQGVPVEIEARLPSSLSCPLSLASSLISLCHPRSRRTPADKGSRGRAQRPAREVRIPWARRGDSAELPSLLLCAEVFARWSSGRSGRLSAV